MLTIGIGVLLVIAARPCVVAQFFACDIPKNFVLVAPSNESKAIITQAKMEVYLDANSISFGHNRSNGMTDYRKFRAGQIKFVLRGYLETPDVNGSSKDQRQDGAALEKILEHYSGSLSGAVAYNRVASNSTVSQSNQLPVPEDCHVTLLLTSKNRPGEGGAKTGLKAVHSDIILSQVRQLAESCVRREICPKIHLPEWTHTNQTSLRRSKRTMGETLKEWMLNKILNRMWHETKRRAFTLPRVDLGEKTDVILAGNVLKQLLLCSGKLILTTSLKNNLPDKKNFVRDGNFYTFDFVFNLDEFTFKYARTKYLLEDKLYTGEFRDTIKDVEIKLKFTINWSPKPASVEIETFEINGGKSEVIAISIGGSTKPGEIDVKTELEGATRVALEQLNQASKIKEFQTKVAAHIAKILEPFRFLFV